MMSDLRIVAARPEELAFYLEFLEAVADWLESREIGGGWKPGVFRDSRDYFSDSIDRGEVYLAFVEGQLAGTLRLLLADPIVWPEVTREDATYIYNLAVGRAWAGRQLGRELIQWAEARTAALGRDFVRLDCMAHNGFLCRYYPAAGFEDRGEVDARYPEPIGRLRLRRFEKAVSPIDREGTAARKPAGSKTNG